MRGFVTVVVAVVFQCRADVQRRQRGEYKGLQGSNQQFKRRNEQRQQDRSGRYPNSLQDENQRDQTQYNDVAGGNVGEQTNHQGKRLCEQANEFNNR